MEDELRRWESIPISEAELTKFDVLKINSYLKSDLKPNFLSILCHELAHKSHAFQIFLLLFFFFCGFFWVFSVASGHVII